MNLRSPRARRLLRRVADGFPLTPRGILVAVPGAAAAVFVGVPEMDLVVLVAGAAGVALVVAAVLSVTIGALSVGRASRSAPRGDLRLLETARLFETGVAFPSLRWLPLVQVELEWGEPDGADVVLAPRGARAAEVVQFSRRGSVRALERRVVVRDALGLAAIGRWRRGELALDVLPHTGGLRGSTLVASLASGDELPHPMGLEGGDRVDLRRYAAGDPARFVHWKVFARTRRLVVRTPERALSHARRTVGYLVAGPEDDATAAVARVVVEGGALGPDWVFGADGASGAVRDPRLALEAIVASRAAEDRGATGLVAFAAAAEREGPARVVLFVPPVPGPWLARVVAFARRRGHGVHVIVGVDGIEPRAERRLRDWLVRRSSRTRTRREDLDAVLAALGSARCLVTVLDRPTGRAIGAARVAAVAAGRAA